MKDRSESGVVELPFMVVAEGAIESVSKGIIGARKMDCMEHYVVPEVSVPKMNGFRAKGRRAGSTLFI